MNVSASKVNDLRQCSYSFYLKNIERLPDRVHPRTHEGSFVHYVVEALLVPKRAAMLVRALEGFTFESFPSMARYAKGYQSKHQLSDFDLTEIGQMIHLALQTIKPDLSGKYASEKRFEIRIDDAICTGYIDILSYTGKRIIDLKTKGRRFSSKEISNNLQAIIYQMAVYEEVGELWPVDFVMLRFPPTKRKPTYHVQTVPPPAPEHIAGLKYYVKHIFHTINNFGLKEAYSAFCTDSFFCDRICPFVRSFKYLHVTTKEGALIGNYFLDKIPHLGDNVVTEVRHYRGCPLYNKTDA